MVEVHSQTAPYLTFMGEILPNNSYVDLSLVGQGGTVIHDSGRQIVCHTDLETCCKGSDDKQGWFFPHGFLVRYSFAMKRLHKGVGLERVSNINDSIHSGIYHCAIETVAVSGEGGTGKEKVYVGLYESGGIHIGIYQLIIGVFTILYVYTGSVSITLSDFKYSVNDAVLICISTGGPATTVTWTRDSEIIPDNKNTQVTVLDDSSTGKYIHTLKISGIPVSSVYECSVSNNKPSSAKVVGTLNREGACILVRYLLLY